MHDSNPESSFSLIRGSEASDQFRSPKRQSSLKMYVPLSLCLKPIKILNMGRDNKFLKLEMLYFFFYPSVANKEQRESNCQTLRIVENIFYDNLFFTQHSVRVRFSKLRI